MSDDNKKDEIEGQEDTTNYNPPPKKTIEEIVSLDQEDESLRKYKEALLGNAQSEKVIIGMEFYII